MATIIVTGAGSGIGHAVTMKLLEQGHHVSAWDIDRGMLSEVTHPSLAFVRVDVAVRAEMDAAVQVALNTTGRIDGLVNCAAIFNARPFLEIDEALWDRTFAINLTGGLLASQAVLPIMRRQAPIEGSRGSIVFFSSGIARGAAVNAAHYGATKGGVLGLARSMALDVAAEGIRVNVVSPGITDTAQPRGNHPVERIYAQGASIPLGRIGQPDDIVGTVLFLLGPDSSFVTGQDIRVNGGARLF
jgi:NAD(P)-dependent dehydrogenase (short-subunit alcohol dehydrogenase family)